jgi:hypothetical protein
VRASADVGFPESPNPIPDCTREELLAMWTTFALASVLILAPGDSGPLELTNVRSTYGILGGTRADDKYLPGDVMILSFDMNGVQTDESGRVLYSIAMEVADESGKVRFKQPPHDLEANNSLGGSSLPAYATIQIGTDQPPGNYTLKVIATDRAAKTSQTLNRTFQVLPADFGLVRVSTSTDPEARVSAPFLGEGQTLWVNFSAVGFERDKSKGQPNLAASMTILDDMGRPTVGKPFTGEVTDKVPATTHGVPLQFILDLNRAGKFTVELRATDKVSGKTASLSFPLTVLKTK